jgi:hypothetical protein
MPNLQIQVLDDENIVYIDHEIITTKYDEYDIMVALAPLIPKGRFKKLYFDKDCFVIEHTPHDEAHPVRKYVGDCGIQVMETLATDWRKFAVSEQENAAYWHANSRYHINSAHQDKVRREYAIQCQEHAAHSAGMARYRMGIDTYPTTYDR